MTYDDDEFEDLDENLLDSGFEDELENASKTSYNYDEDDYSFDDEDDDNSYELE